MEQCLNETDGENEQPLGITFRLLTASGHCDDGLLICYPSYLLGHHGSFQTKGQFIVGDGKDNKIAKECAEKMRKDGISAGGKHWRGIKVQTKPKSGPNREQMSNIVLETSFTNQSINVGLNRRQFSIRFDGNDQSDSFTMFSPSNNDSNQRDLQNEFVDNLPKSAFLGEFAGFWLLGLDMLPPMNAVPSSSMRHENVQLYIHRGAQCTMEAWFTQPSDSVNPIDPEVSTVGPKSFPPVSTSPPVSTADQQFTTNVTASEQQSINNSTTAQSDKKKV
ncbi:hypothetical protein niasHT_029626 [Heterodera trifolii]|uniref:Uncharacterized protein n=1 Tax=Heterodera trifolii TaxID=157864 RepID=A0ABD2JLG0_9BILA